MKRMQAQDCEAHGKYNEELTAAHLSIYNIQRQLVIVFPLPLSIFNHRAKIAWCSSLQYSAAGSQRASAQPGSALTTGRFQSQHWNSIKKKKKKCSFQSYHQDCSVICEEQLQTRATPSWLHARIMERVCTLVKQRLATTVAVRLGATADVAALQSAALFLEIFIVSGLKTDSKCNMCNNLTWNLTLDDSS